MAEIDRISEPTEWIDLGFVERQRTSKFAIRVGIQFHLPGLSLSNTKQYRERLGVKRSRTAIHDWVKKADLQPNSDAEPNQIAVDETMIRVTGKNTGCTLWSILSRTNPSTYVCFRRAKRKLPCCFSVDSERNSSSQTTLLIDDAAHLNVVLDRLGIRFRVIRHGSRNAVEIQTDAICQLARVVLFEYRWKVKKVRSGNQIQSTNLYYM